MYFVLIFISILLLLVAYIFMYKSSPKPFDLRGSHALITGGSLGIGKCIAIELLQRGANVTLVARNQQQLDETKGELRQHYKINEGQWIETLSLDVASDFSVINECLSKHMDKVGPVDVLVNNAGIYKPVSFMESPIEEFKTHMDVNYLGTVYVTRSVLSRMIDLPQGRILFISSVGGQTGCYGYSAYCASKFALRGLAETLQEELKPYNIRITMSFPGETVTPGQKVLVQNRPKETAMIENTVGISQPDDVAKQSVEDMIEGKFLSSIWFEPRLATILTCGLAPATSVTETLIQCMSMGVIRLVSLYYAAISDKIVADCKKERDDEKENKKEE